MSFLWDFVKQLCEITQREKSKLQLQTSEWAERSSAPVKSPTAVVGGVVWCSPQFQTQMGVWLEEETQEVEVEGVHHRPAAILSPIWFPSVWLALVVEIPLLQQMDSIKLASVATECRENREKTVKIDDLPLE